MYLVGGKSPGGGKYLFGFVIDSQELMKMLNRDEKYDVRLNIVEQKSDTVLVDYGTPDNKERKQYYTYKVENNNMGWSIEAGVCAACGMLEIAKYVPEEEGRRYTQEAINILKACDKHFCNYEEDEDALVLMGSGQYPHNETDFKGVHIPMIYGDFFFVEALFKLKGNDFLIW